MSLEVAESTWDVHRLRGRAGPLWEARGWGAKLATAAKVTGAELRELGDVKMEQDLGEIMFLALKLLLRKCIKGESTDARPQPVFH